MANVRLTKPRRPKGSGSVFYHEGRQLWTATVELAPQITGYDKQHSPIKTRSRKQIYGRTKTEVVQRLKALLIEGGQAPNARGRVTLEQHLNRWLKDVAVERRATTHATYETMVRLHIVPTLGAVRLDRLTPEAIRGWVHDLQRSKIGARSLQLAFVLLKSALESANVNGLIATNPCRGIPRPKYEAEERVALGAEDLRRLLAAARGQRLGATVALAIGTGARQGEILGLRWRNVNVDRGVLQIEAQLQGGKSAQLKTKASKRNIPLPALCVKALKEHRARMEREGRSTKPDAFVFVGETGKPLDRHNYIKRVFAPLTEKAELEGVTFHQLRHTWATLQSGLGMPVRDMSAMLGHSKTSVTMDIYAHAVSDAQRKGSEALNAVLTAKSSK